MQDLPRALAAVRAVARATQGDVPLVDVLGQLCREVAESLGFERVSISRVEEDPEGPVAAGLAAYGIDDETAHARSRVADLPTLARAYETRALVFVRDARSEPSLPAELVDALGVTSMVAVPLVSDGRCIGFLAGDRGGDAFALDEDERDVLTTIGVVAATLVEKDLVREALRRLDTAKTQFLAFAVHELRTPAQAVYGALATLHHRGGSLAEEQLVELRALAHDQAERLRQLVDQLLDLSRIEASAITVAPSEVHVRRLIEEIVLLVAEQDAPHVEIAVADDLEAALDPEALDRIVSNLVLNALRHGAPPVRVEAVQSDRHLRVRVEDRGPGIPRELVPQLFERFRRSDRSQGSGLGLSIAQAYARAHGGDILYHDAQPHGACFEVVIPARRR